MPQYIPMCEPSHQSLIIFLKKWISSQPVSHVNHSVRPVQEKELKTTDGYGTQYFKPLSKLDLPSYSWKMFQTSLMNGGHLMKFQNPFPKSGSILNGQMYERQMLGPIIKETVYSYLLTKKVHSQNSLFPTLIKSEPSILPTPTTTGNQLCPSEIKKGGSLNNLKAISNLHGGEGTRLSPLFVEWMMGFPTGWTDLEV